MGVTRYQADAQTWWRVDEWVVDRDGRHVRFRKKRIPTKEQALAVAAKARTESFEGNFLGRRRLPRHTVAELWKSYAPAAERDNDSWASDKGRAKHLLRHLGNMQADRLTLKEVDAYRDARLKEKTQRGTPPTPGTLDREVELLKRLLGYAVKSGELKDHPLRGVQLLRKPNVRRMVLDEAGFQRLFAAAEEALQPILLLAFDTGMRKEEVLALRWEQVELEASTIALAPEDTKTDEPRLIVLTSRAKEALRTLPSRFKKKGFVFVNPKTKTRRVDIKKQFRRAVAAAELHGLWFHDLRRSFVTRARRVGVPESVVMRMSGHRTRAVFERYNVVDTQDLRAAVRALESLGHV
jgi:integrase